MILKRAKFVLSDVVLLNEPKVADFVLDEDLLPDKEAREQIISDSNKTATLTTDGDAASEFDLEAEIKNHPDSLFVKCFAIRADEMNDNGDFFSKDELKKGTHTFVGVPVFTNHQNSDIEQSRGKVIHSWWNEEENGIMIIARVDAVAYPQLARGIKEKYVIGTSMGAQVHHSLCSICHNYAENPDDYCEHIRERKTRPVTARKQKCAYHKNGPEEHCPICNCTKKEGNTFPVDKKAFEYNYGIKFIENSFVVNPAFRDCGVREVIDPQVFLSKAASILERVPRLEKVAQNIKVASSDDTFESFLNVEKFRSITDNIVSVLPKLLEEVANTDVMCDNKKCVKLAGEKELQDLNTAVEILSTISKSMLDQKAQIDLEFLSDTVKILADLQELVDELTQQGYGRLPSSGDPGSEQMVEGTPAPGAESDAGMGLPAGVSGAESQVHSGNAGQVGTVTSPNASSHIRFKKMAKRLNINAPSMKKLIWRKNMK